MKVIVYITFYSFLNWSSNNFLIALNFLNSLKELAVRRNAEYFFLFLLFKENSNWYWTAWCMTYPLWNNVFRAWVLIMSLKRIICWDNIYLYDFKFKILKKRFYLFILERGREGEREEEKHQCAVASHTPPTGDLARNPGTCPDWELNQRSFDLQASTQFTELHELGLNLECF